MNKKLNEGNDIYQLVKKDGELDGVYFNKSPMRAGRKIAKKVYNIFLNAYQSGELPEKKEIFDVKIYNRTKDKYYTYNVVVKEKNRTKIINGKEIKMYEDLILTRI